MDFELKHALLKALDERGHGEAVLVTKHVLDHDNDVTEDRAIGEQSVQILKGHNWSQGTSLGKGRTYETASEVRLSFDLYVDMAEAEDLRKYLVNDLSHPPPLAEWSYGFKILTGGSRTGTHEGKSARFLQPLPGGQPGLWVREASVVMSGAGVNTRLIAAKEAQMESLIKKQGVLLREQADLLSQYAQEASVEAREARERRAWIQESVNQFEVRQRYLDNLRRG